MHRESYANDFLVRSHGPRHATLSTRDFSCLRAVPVYFL